jgi:MFS family permease
MVQEPLAGGVGLGLDPVRAALVLVPGAVAMLAVAPVAVRSGRVVGHAEVVKVAGIVSALGFCSLVARADSVASIVLGSTVVSIGVGLALGCLPALVLDHAPPGRAGEAAGTNSLSRGIGSALGVQVTTVVLGVGSFTADAYAGAFVVGVVCSVATTCLVRGARNRPDAPECHVT